ncbi:hypothetical protein DPMN_086646 [Dreissena polymorpha]|uniref:Ion transport domain-containing protein n=2 Tax=Dreissena polymorpha TaxID=45954 RepID=A0A9D4KQU3_DREPO|nr:hypothetical protein DPMN_086646 [Dreissena polymorpha]
MYFALFYMFVTVITINIITAFVLDMFLYEYRMQLEDKKDSTIEKKIKELGLGIDEETGMEISQPLSDEQLKEWMMKHDITAPDVQPWNANASLKQFPGIKHVDVDMTNSRSYLQQRQSTYPALNKYDGIRFHIKKRGWTKVEVLLQQLYESENDNSPVNDTESNLAVRVSNV